MKQSKSDLTKQYIVERSSAVFNTKGYMGTSMQDIMDATGLTKGGLYGNYKSKEAIAFAAFDYNVKKVMDRMSKMIVVEKNAPDKLNAILNFFKSYYFEPPVAGGCPILNMAIEADDTHPGLRLKVVEALEALRASLIHILKKGQSYGQIKADADVNKFATIFLSTIEGGIMMSKVYQDFRHLRDCIAHLSELTEQIKT